MSLMMRVSRRDASGVLVPRGWMFWCQGCDGYHEVATDEPNECGARWSFDGNVEAPTFSPPLRCRPMSATRS
jgi:hypothetical protein